jgi:hypothetical protein
VASPPQKKIKHGQATAVEHNKETAKSNLIKSWNKEFRLREILASETHYISVTE